MNNNFLPSHILTFGKPRSAIRIASALLETIGEK